MRVAQAHTTTRLDDGLRAALREVAATRTLLVATALDGTLTPLPGAEYVHAERKGLRALRHLVEATDARAAVISGRSLRDLALASRLPEEVILVGSHGAETGPDLTDELDAATRALLDRLQEEARSIAAAIPGARFERKPAGFAVRMHGLKAAQSRWIRERVRGGLGIRRGVRVIDGPEVVELTLAEADKGKALDRLRERTGASAVVYLGDDEADEAAFTALGDGDVGVRVGGGRTAAAHRVHDVDGVADVLETLTALRANA